MITGISGEARVGFELLEDGDAVQLGHHDVEEDDVSRVRAQELERFPSVLGRPRPMTLLLEQANEELAVERVVVDDEDATPASSSR